MGTAARSALISVVVAGLVAGVAALTLWWLVPSNSATVWAVTATAVGVAITASARAEGKGISWGQALARGCVAAAAAGVTSWFLGRH